MRKWVVFAAMFAVSALAIALVLMSQRPAKMPRVAFLGMDSGMQKGRLAAFQQGMRDLGYIDGKNIAYEYRWAEGQFDHLPALGAELVALNPDVLVTAAPPAIRALQQATTTIPIVMATGNEPVTLGFVASLAHPGGNITGLAFQDTDLSAKRLELLQRAVPGLMRLAILWNGLDGIMPELAKRRVESAARSLGIEVLVIEVREPANFAAGIAAAKAWNAAGLVDIASPFITKHRKLLVDALRANRLPAMCTERILVAEGCLMTYSANYDAMFRRAADFVDRILKGANPADMAVEQPREFEFVINMKTAAELGLDIPPALRLQANEVISAQ